MSTTRRLARGRAHPRKTRSESFPLLTGAHALSLLRNSAFLAALARALALFEHARLLRSCRTSPGGPLAFGTCARVDFFSQLRWCALCERCEHHVHFEAGSGGGSLAAPAANLTVQRPLHGGFNSFSSSCRAQAVTAKKKTACCTVWTVCAAGCAPHIEIAPHHSFLRNSLRL